MDTVHQGNHDGEAGLFHINAVDTVTQRQVVGCVETISERHLIPVPIAMLHPFHFSYSASTITVRSLSIGSWRSAGKTADRVHQVAGLSDHR